MRLQQRLGNKREADQLPLINIVFLMLVFFLLAGVIAPAADLDVNPPYADSAPEGSPHRAAIYVAPGGRLSFRGSAVSLEDLSAILGQAVLDPDQGLRVVADRQTDARQVLDVVAAARAAGVSQIVLATVTDDTP